MVEMINSLEDLCRLCASKVDVLMGLDIFSSDHRQILRKISVCLPIQVSVGDNLPKMVCVECACKLDLMFDFRERSILTAHLFADMLTVNNDHVLGVDKDIIISTESETVENSFGSEDYLECNDRNVKLERMEVSKQENIVSEITIEQANNFSSESAMFSSPILMKLKDSTVKKVDDENITNESHDVAMLDEENKTLTYSDSTVIIQEFNPGMDDDLSNCVTSKNIFSDFKKEESIVNNDPPVSDATRSESNDPDWFLCNVCGEAFDEREAFYNHFEQHWKKCNCGVLFSSEEALKAHELEVHSPNKKKVKHKKKGKLKGDKRNENHSNIKKLYFKSCTECGKQYQTNYKLQEHMRKHTGEKPYSCSYEDCKKAFRSKIGLAQHEASHSGQFEFSCSTCGKGFQCKSYLVVHQRVHSDLKPFICKQCDQKFKTKQSLLDHMNRHLGVKPFLCDICGRGFITKGLCKSHQKVHSGTDNRQYPCHVCRKLFVSKSYLNTHFRIHTGEKPFMCEVCGKGFLTRVDLRIHSTMHTGEKSFVCETCGKAFARRDALRCHRRSHTGERPYKCEFCGQSFTQFSPMAIHKRLHTGERPYECDVCTKSFVSRSTMIAHRKKHHPDTVEDFRFVEVEIQPDMQKQDDGSREGVVILEESPQLLSALSKTRLANSGQIISALKKCRPDNPVVIDVTVDS